MPVEQEFVTDPVRGKHIADAIKELDMDAFVKLCEEKDVLPDPEWTERVWAEYQRIKAKHFH